LKLTYCLDLFLKISEKKKESKSFCQSHKKSKQKQKQKQKKRIYHFSSQSQYENKDNKKIIKRNKTIKKIIIVF